jgi:sugar O-acyltransferase (sialic acid O-acetyltransferase NeuD family)
MKKNLTIVGAGEQGRVILDVVRSGTDFVVKGFLDDSLKGEVKGVPIIGKIKNFEYKKLENYFIAIGNNHTRKKISEIIKSSRGNLVKIIHSSAIISDSSKIGEGCFIGPGTIICNDSYIGKGSIIDTGSIIEHDCKIGKYVKISPNSLLVSGNQIGDYSWIGSGAIINEDIVIGKNCIVGAGSLILKNVPKNSLYFGIPAKEKGKVDKFGKHNYNI